MPTKTISHDELKNLSFVVKSGILQTSFEYLIVKLCEKYCEANSIKTIAEFNRENNISIIKAIVFPFFVTTSNGHYKALYSLFGDFKYSENVGFMSEKVLNNLIDKETFKIEAKTFEIDLRTSIKNTQLTWNRLLDNILKENIQLNDANLNYRNIQIKKDDGCENSLCNAIDSGIDTLLELTSGKFFNYTEEVLRNKSKRYNSLNSEKEKEYDRIDEIRKSFYYAPLKETYEHAN